MLEGGAGVPISSPYCPDNTLPLLETVSEDQEIHARRNNGQLLDAAVLSSSFVSFFRSVRSPNLIQLLGPFELTCSMCVRNRKRNDVLFNQYCEEVRSLIRSSWWSDWQLRYSCCKYPIIRVETAA
jgi:hypothetical protein